MKGCLLNESMPLWYSILTGPSIWSRRSAAALAVVWLLLLLLFSLIVEVSGNWGVLVRVFHCASKVCCVLGVSGKLSLGSFAGVFNKGCCSLSCCDCDCGCCTCNGSRESFSSSNNSSVLLFIARSKEDTDSAEETCGAWVSRSLPCNESSSKTTESMARHLEGNSKLTTVLVLVSDISSDDFWCLRYSWYSSCCWCCWCCCCRVVYTIVLAHSISQSFLSWRDSNLRWSVNTTPRWNFKRFLVSRSSAVVSRGVSNTKGTMVINNQ